jgi:hypothetical protein
MYPLNNKFFYTCLNKKNLTTTGTIGHNKKKEHNKKTPSGILRL